VTGAQEIREDHLACKRRIYVEFRSVRVADQSGRRRRRDDRTLAAHDTLFTFAKAWTRRMAACHREIPLAADAPTGRARTLGQSHRPIPGPPIIPSPPGTTRAKTSSARDIPGIGPRTASLKKILDLPRHRPQSSSSWPRPWTRKSNVASRHGWRQIPSLDISRDIDRYRITSSIARRIHRGARPVCPAQDRLFSDRSACYLRGPPRHHAGDRLSRFFPSGKGLFGFQTMDDI